MLTKAAEDADEFAVDESRLVLAFPVICCT
jgi:hypothetical protein